MHHAPKQKDENIQRKIPVAANELSLVLLCYQLPIKHKIVPTNAGNKFTCTHAKIWFAQACTTELSKKRQQQTDISK